MIKTFAPDFPRNEHGWIKFPRDLSYRRKYLPEAIHKEVSLHPAKMNLYLCEAIVEFVSNEGETILDPFGGVGTTMVAAMKHNRNVILLELEPIYVSLENQTLDFIRKQYFGATVMILPGDNRRYLPIPCDHIITSPPFGNDLAKQKGAVSEEEQYKVGTYAANPVSLGRLNPFYYVQHMKPIYEKMVESIRQGGTITITHRDRSRGGERILYAKSIMETMARLGMKLYVWEKWEPPGSHQATLNKKLGHDVVLDEDILIFSKS